MTERGLRERQSHNPSIPEAMNELDKQTPEQEVIPTSDAACAASGVEKECAETESPAMTLSEAADAALERKEAQEDGKTCVETGSPALEPAAAADEAESVCAEGESPSLSLSEVADEQVAGDKADEPFQTLVHSLDKKQLLETLKKIVETESLESHREVTAIKQAYYALKTRENNALLKEYVDAGNLPESFSMPVDPADNEMRDLLAVFKEKRNAFLELKEVERQKNLDEKRRILEEIRALSDDIDNINLKFPKFQELQNAFKAVGDVPPGSDNEIWKSYQLAIEQFYDRLKMNKELRDLDFKKNLEIKQRLIADAKELEGLSDPVDAFKKLQTLHNIWKQTGPVAKELRDGIWDEFREISTAINKRHQDYFQGRKAEEQANEIAKTALCEEAEAIKTDELKTFNDWEKATKQIIELQERWRQLGFASKKVNNQLFSRFRKSCDDFFRSKAEFYKKIKEGFSVNLEKKKELCERAEAMMDRVDERNAHEVMMALQNEWKTVGSVSRRHSDDIWQRFTKACNAFYDARKKRMNARRDDENANLAAKKAVIAALKEISEESERKEVIGRIRELQDQWQGAGHVPFKYKDKIYAEYRAELDRLYNAFDMRENRQRVNRFAREVREMEGDDSRLGREREKLQRALEGKRMELKTMENNMGFFNVKSSAGSSMLKDLERRIGRVKDDIAQIQEKIKVLDGQPKA